MVDRRAKGLLLRGGDARVVVVIVLSREQHRRAEQRRNQVPVIVASTAPDEEADVVQRPSGSSAQLSNLGIAFPKLLGELHAGIAVLILEPSGQRRELDLFDILHPRIARIPCHGVPIESGVEYLKVPGAPTAAPASRRSTSSD